MKTTGIVRKLDTLGRVTIPNELRKILGIENGKSHIEIFVDGETIIFKKYRVGRACAITGKVSNENKVYEGNIILSPEGEEKLFKQLSNKRLNQNKV